MVLIRNLQRSYEIVNKKSPKVLRSSKKVKSTKHKASKYEFGATRANLDLKFMKFQTKEPMLESQTKEKEKISETLKSQYLTKSEIENSRNYKTGNRHKMINMKSKIPFIKYYRHEEFEILKKNR